MAAIPKHKQVQKEPLQEEPKGQPKPTIEYIGEGAEKVKFTINPNASRYVVHNTGLVKEYL